MEVTEESVNLKIEDRSYLIWEETKECGTKKKFGETMAEDFQNFILNVKLKKLSEHKQNKLKEFHT